MTYNRFIYTILFGWRVGKKNLFRIKSFIPTIFVTNPCKNKFKIIHLKEKFSANISSISPKNLLELLKCTHLGGLIIQSNFV